MVFEKVKSVIVEQLGLDEAEVTMEANFADDCAPRKRGKQLVRVA